MIIGPHRRALCDAGVSGGEVSEFMTEATSGDLTGFFPDVHDIGQSCQKHTRLRTVQPPDMTPPVDA